MMFNIFLEKIKKYKSLHVLFLFPLILVASCQTGNKAEERFFAQFSTDFSPVKDKSPLVMHSYIDVNPFYEEGFAWAPFVLPNQEWLPIRLSDFLIGFWNGKNNPILPPDPGICRILDDSEISSLPRGELKLVQFFSNSITPYHDEKKLFFLLSPETRKPFAIVKMDYEGKASCFIALKKYVVSTGYGELRREFEVNGSENKVKVPFFDSSYVKILASDLNGIKNGDILRIGRSFSKKNIKSIEENFEDGGFLIPSKLSGDLYQTANIQSKRMNVDEFQKTAILIGENPFEMQLEPALYTFAVLRKNKLICLKTIELTDNEIFEFTCKESERNIEDFEQDFNSVFFDTTLLPPQFIESSAFLSWLFSSKQYLLPYFNVQTQELEVNKDVEQEINKKFQFIALDNKKNYANLYPHYLIHSNKLTFSASNFDINKIYLAITNKSQDISIDLRRDGQNLPFLGIPLGGISEQQLAHNSVLFSVFTKINRIVPRAEFLNYSNVQASNGTTFSIFEPLTMQNNEGMFSSYVQQKFRLRVVIPAWNATNVVEMYVNGKLRRRWVLDRGDISKPFSASFEENINESKAFTVRWIAWGDEYLPDFLIGANHIQPFSITRDFCIDYSGDGLCHLEQIK